MKSVQLSHLNACLQWKVTLLNAYKNWNDKYVGEIDSGRNKESLIPFVNYDSST